MRRVGRCAIGVCPSCQRGWLLLACFVQCRRIKLTCSVFQHYVYCYIFTGDAARKGAHVILLQELFASTYFCIEQIDYFRLAISLDDDKSYVTRFQNLARELNVVLPLSFYERSK